MHAPRSIRDEHIRCDCTAYNRQCTPCNRRHCGNYSSAAYAAVPLSVRRIESLQYRRWNQSDTEGCDSDSDSALGLRHGVVVDEPHNAQMCARLLPVPISLTLGILRSGSLLSLLTVDHEPVRSTACRQLFKSVHSAPSVTATTNRNGCAPGRACVRAWYTLPQCARTIVHVY